MDSRQFTSEITLKSHIFLTISKTGNLWKTPENLSKLPVCGKVLQQEHYVKCAQIRTRSNSVFVLFSPSGN